MKSICFLSGIRDISWIKDYTKAYSGTEEIIIFAPSFEAQILGINSGLSINSYEQIAWSIDRNELFDKARQISYQWSKEQTKENNNIFKSYPLSNMYQSMVMLACYEILQSIQFVKKIFELENPDKVMVGKSENSFVFGVLYWLNCNHGLEKEALKVLSKKIEFVEITPQNSNYAISKQRLIKNIKIAINNILLNLSGIKINLQKFSIAYDSSLSNFDIKSSHKKILVFSCGGYYLKQISEAFDDLLSQNIKLYIVIVGDRLTKEEATSFKKKGILFFYKSNIKISNQNQNTENINKIIRDYISEIENKNINVGNLFNDEGIDFSRIMVDFFKGNLLPNISKTVIEIKKSKKIIEAIKPDLVFSHFAMHANESCDILPARKLGIPTLSMMHGIWDYNDAERDTFASEYYAVAGKTAKKAREEYFRKVNSNIFNIGELRFEKLKNTLSKKEAKIKFSLDPDRPVCIFCDQSEWNHTSEFRHSTTELVKQILLLNKQFPELQIIYRVHHGSDYSAMVNYFKQLDNSNVLFQVSPIPLFSEIVETADFVISHYTSAVSESLILGIPVIYLCALSIPEPSFFGYDIIKIADTFHKLQQHVSDLIENPMTREEVKKKAQPYFDNKLCGLDGKAAIRLSELMVKLVNLPAEKRQKGWADWEERIEASANFKSETWLNYLPDSLHHK